MAPTTWSTFGPEVDVSAPGTCVYTTAADSEHGVFEGTSAAAPIAAGLAALLFAAHPGWSAEQVASRIVETAHDGGDARYGAGTIDFAAALAGE